MTGGNLLALLPEILIGTGIVFTLLGDLFLKEKQKLTFLFLLNLAVTVAAGVAFLSLPLSQTPPVYGIVDDLWRRAFALILILGFLYTLFLSDSYLGEFSLPQGEYYVLLLSTLLGMLLLVSTVHLGFIFLGIELMSLPLYSLCALRPGEKRGGEGALKYFVLGSVASAFLLMGIALFYLLSGSLLVSSLPKLTVGTLPLLSWFFLLIGIAFKLALVPFHSWSPDAYEGAPLPVTAWMSTGVKVAVVGAFARLWVNNPPPALIQGFALLLFITVVIGNLLAIRQENLKRFFAYSSIAHAGYLGVGLFHPGVDELAAVLFYLLVYTIMTMGAFAVLVASSRGGREAERLELYRGLSSADGFLSFAFALTLLSLAGIPPLGGFTAKLFLFAAAIEGGALPLVLVAVIASLAGVYYYLRPIVVMFMEEGAAPSSQESPERDRLTFLLVLTSFLLFYLGLFPGNLLQYFREVAARLLAHGQ